MHESRHRSVLVVGAGPAGLATSHALRRLGLDHVVLERAASVGASWRAFYDSLVLHTGKHLSSLPGRPFRRSDPLFVPRPGFVEYLERYAAAEEVPVETGAEARSAKPTAGGWVVDTTTGRWHGAVLIVATGIAMAPRPGAIPGLERFRGTVRHSIAYRDPVAFRGRRTLVVGAGNSGAEIAAELGAAGVATTIAVRSGVLVVPLTVARIPSQYLGIGLRKLPRSIGSPIARTTVAIGARRRRDGLPRSSANPLDIIPIVGMHLSEAIRAGAVRVRPGAVAMEPTSVRYADGVEEDVDDIILATGFTAAIAWLDGLVARDARGFARRRERVVSADQPRLLFVGHSYDAGGGLVNIRRDAPLAAEAAATMLESR